MDSFLMPSEIEDIQDAFNSIEWIPTQLYDLRPRAYTPCLSIPLNGFLNVDEATHRGVPQGFLSIPLNGFLTSSSVATLKVTVASFQFH